MAASDDDIIRKRLLIDGDGGMDDRRITSLLRSYIKWCNTQDTEEESSAAFQRMLVQLAQCEHTMEKSVMVYNMNQKEQIHYDKLNTDIEKCITEAYEKITDCKSELQKARMIRRNRQHYDAIAAQIEKLPDRQGTMKQLETLDKELSEMQGVRGSLEQKLELRRKQFHVLIAAIHEMQRILEVDEKVEPSEGGATATLESMET